MKLLVDMGNSRMKWATIADGMLSPLSSVAYDRFAELKNDWQNIGVLEQVWVSCVTEEAHWSSIEQLSQMLWGLTAQRISSLREEHGVSNAYVDAAQLGSDRWATLIAAHQLYSTPVCVVDCGTALTVDGLSAKGQHLGGVIVPGVQMMQSSLNANTAAISTSGYVDDHILPTSLLANDTASGIINGSWLSVVGVVVKVYESLSEQNNDKVVCLLTGGNAALLAKQLPELLRSVSVVDPGLVLKGLAVMAGESITI